MLHSTRRVPAVLRSRFPAPFLLRSAHHAPFALSRKPASAPTEANPEQPMSQKPPEPPSVTLKRALKYSTYTVLGLALAATAAYLGHHAHTEYVGLAPEADKDVAEWEWDLLENQWSTDPARGGTDPGLSFNARRWVRAAWQIYTLDIDQGNATAAVSAPESETGFQAFDVRLVRAAEFLANAISAAEMDRQHNKLSPYTIPILRLRLAIILEQLGGVQLPYSKRQYEEAWQSFPDTGPYKAYVALKLGDLNRHLGHNEDALRWWTTSLQLTQPSNKFPADINNIIAPQSPCLQRIFFSGLVSRSAYLASTGKFKEAEALQQKSLELLRAIPSPPSFQSTPAPQALHALYLLQRSSILSVHLAETLFATKHNPKTSIPWLTTAAQSSERVALLLTGAPVDLPDPALANVPKKMLLSTYADSRAMAPSAANLLRDAQRTAAEAWNLLGILIEKAEGPTSVGARACFQRAIYWASAPSADGQMAHASDAVPEMDWGAYQANLQRVEKAQEKK